MGRAPSQVASKPLNQVKNRIKSPVFDSYAHLAHVSCQSQRRISAGLQESSNIRSYLWITSQKTKPGSFIVSISAQLCGVTQGAVKPEYEDLYLP